MKYRTLGTTDIEVSAVCLGAWSLIGDFTWGRQGRRDSVAAIHAALDAGVNFIDTAEAYGEGESETLLGEVLAGRRREIVLASKVSVENLRPDDLKQHCADSLQRLRTDYLDLYQVHWPSPDVPLADTLGAMEQLKREGKVRVIGVSNFGVGYLREAMAPRRVESNQLCYNLLWRAIEYELKPLCVAGGVGVLCYSPLCQGLLTGKFTSADEVPVTRARMRLFSKDRPHSRHDEEGCEDELFAAVAQIRRVAGRIGEPMAHVSLAWLLAQEGVASVVTGARNAAQAAENAKAADLELPADVLAELSAATETVKAYVGANADIWESVSRMERH